MSQGSHEALEQVVAYMKSHWPSEVKPEWQVSLEDYPKILKQVLADLTVKSTKSRHLVRIAGLSGSGKTTQLLPAVEAYFKKQQLAPVLVAARLFAPYHPHYQEIESHYGAENVRRLTDEFSTIMMFLVLTELTKGGYDIILDVTLLDPAIEQILISLLAAGNYTHFITMIAVSPEIAELHLGSRSWRHSRETEQEFIRATSEALAFYADKTPATRIILWDTYDSEPIYDGPVHDSLRIFTEYSAITVAPPHDELALRTAKLDYFAKLV